MLLSSEKSLKAKAAVLRSSNDKADSLRRKKSAKSSPPVCSQQMKEHFLSFCQTRVEMSDYISRGNFVLSKECWPRISFPKYTALNFEISYLTYQNLWIPSPKRQNLHTKGHFTPKSSHNERDNRIHRQICRSGVMILKSDYQQLSQCILTNNERREGEIEGERKRGEKSRREFSGIRVLAEREVNIGAHTVIENPRGIGGVNKG
jgi:hypothetical protein